MANGSRDYVLRPADLVAGLGVAHIPSPRPRCRRRWRTHPRRLPLTPMQEHTALIVALFAVVSAAVAVWRFLNRRDRRLRRAVRWVDATPIANLREGSLAKVCGEVGLHPAPLVTPITQRDCVMYEVRVTCAIYEEGARKLIVLAEEQSRTDFFVEDDTGRVRVSSADVEAVLCEDTVVRPPSAKLDPRLQHFLVQHDALSFIRTNEIFALQFVESALEPGDLVGVVGVVRTQVDRHDGYRARPAQMVIAAPRRGKVLLSEERSGPEPPTVCPRCGSTALFRSEPDTWVCASCVTLIRL